MVREGPCRQSIAVGLRCAHFGTRKMPSNVPAWRARLLLRRGPAPWLERTSASLGEDIFNISLSNIAFVALAQMLLALLPSFAFLLDLSCSASGCNSGITDSSGSRGAQATVQLCSLCRGLSWCVSKFVQPFGQLPIRPVSVLGVLNPLSSAVTAMGQYSVAP